MKFRATIWSDRNHATPPDVLEFDAPTREDAQEHVRQFLMEKAFNSESGKTFSIVDWEILDGTQGEGTGGPQSHS
jgi:hypothetical protein